MKSRYIASSSPVGVLQGIGNSDCRQLLHREVPKRAARGCEEDAPQALLWNALQALKDGTANRNSSLNDAAVVSSMEQMLPSACLHSMLLTYNTAHCAGGASSP